MRFLAIGGDNNLLPGDRVFNDGYGPEPQQSENYCCRQPDQNMRDDKNNIEVEMVYHVALSPSPFFAKI